MRHNNDINVSHGAPLTLINDIICFFLKSIFIQQLILVQEGEFGDFN